VELGADAHHGLSYTVIVCHDFLNLHVHNRKTYWEVYEHK
jgi:hypothetical protein